MTIVDPCCIRRLGSLDYFGNPMDWVAGQREPCARGSTVSRWCFHCDFDLSTVVGDCDGARSINWRMSV